MPIQIGQHTAHGFDEPLGLLSDCHRRIEHFLNVLVVINERAAGGALTPPQRLDLEAALRYFATAAPKHTADEEESLFPRLRATNDPGAAEALERVARLERDHDEAERHHQAVDALVRRWLDGDGLPAEDAESLSAHLAALRAIYGPHIALEDRELFPAAARLLAPDVLAEVGREMADRRREKREKEDTNG
jgi:hemerythrin-like domain-containing protein